jgi:hypothetical protein
VSIAPPAGAKIQLDNQLFDAPLKKLTGAIEARLVCEPIHHRLKEELGLEHFSGRSGQGLRQHPL